MFNATGKSHIDSILVQLGITLLPPSAPYELTDINFKYLKNSSMKIPKTLNLENSQLQSFRKWVLSFNLSYTKLAFLTNQLLVKDVFGKNVPLSVFEWNEFCCCDETVAKMLSYHGITADTKWIHLKELQNFKCKVTFNMDRFLHSIEPLKTPVSFQEEVLAYALEQKIPKKTVTRLRICGSNCNKATSLLLLPSQSNKALSAITSLEFADHLFLRTPSVSKLFVQCIPFSDIMRAFETESVPVLEEVIAYVTQSYTSVTSDWKSGCIDRLKSRQLFRCKHLNFCQYDTKVGY